MSRPRIGLAPCFLHADPQRPVFKGKTLLYLEESLSHWLQRAGALPLMLPTPAGDITLEELLAQVDGLVLQGGSDVCPGSYGEEPLRPEWCGDPVRDAYEIALVRACMAADKPVLGVCRGMQVLNVALGGTLWQDLTTQNPACRTHRDWDVYDALSHDVRIEPDSWLAAWTGAAEARRVNSVHHQGVRTLGDGLRTEAVSVEDGVVEAVRYDPDGGADPDGAAPFVYGVQWHPEFQAADDTTGLDGRPVLAAFLRAVGLRRSKI
ncbi:MAG TPA: gamma-glutamyl-gamma-aminobutyrate hydrolase family protein [Longimicrobium sp.]|nr:gamma-glutamyl-gamma-aminobutyrate hydrolase family protein [Longimicrobium sp.]